MSMSVNSSGINLNTGSNQYEEKISQLETQLQTYEAELQKETDTEKQAELQQKIENIQNQIKNYETKLSSSSTSDSSTDSSSGTSTSINDIKNKSSDTLEISAEGKVMSDMLKALKEGQEDIDKKDQIKTEKGENRGTAESEKAEKGAAEKEKAKKEEEQKLSDPSQLIGNNISVLV